MIVLSLVIVVLLLLSAAISWRGKWTAVLGELAK